MKPFVFRLQTALDIKIHQEERAKEELHKATVLYENSLQLLQYTKQHLFNLQGELREMQKKTLDVDEVMRCQQFIPVLDRQIEMQQLEVAAKKSELEKVRAQLVELMRERKVLEKIKSRHYQEHLKLALLEEQKLIDEMATNRFIRKDKQT